MRATVRVSQSWPRRLMAFAVSLTVLALSSIVVVSAMPARAQAAPVLASPARSLPTSAHLMRAQLATSSAWERLRAWILRNYRRAPALMLGLAAIVALPMLAVLGLIVRRLFSPRAAPGRAVAPAPIGGHVGPATTVTRRRDGLTWPVDAWIEVDGDRGTRRPIVHDLMRIGREADNEIVLEDEHVHRYHAAIRRTEDAEILVVDLSPPDGAGVLLNGTKVSEARLRNDDVIILGGTRLRIIARPS